MSLLVTLTFRQLPRSGALEASAREVGNRLQRLNDGMTACHIVFESAPEAAGGVPFRVKIHLSVPGAQIHAERSCSYSPTQMRQMIFDRPTWRRFPRSTAPAKFSNHSSPTIPHWLWL